MSVQRKRLFVGGLNSGTKEQDIRERFKTFGSVSSVEVHVRPKSEGFPEKTFAYVDIDASDSNIKKCVTMLSNTKWKGGILKIQLAKESFLSRLQREREEINSKGEGKKSKSPLLPSELASSASTALPGTLIPGKKNWVVGKFDRVLPVVHMRQAGSHKICRIDPSKTVHNLKRIKEDSDEKPVSELTWSLEEDNDEVLINGDTHEKDIDDTDSSSAEEIAGKTNFVSPNKKKKKNLRRNEIENINENEDKEVIEGKKDKKESSLKNYLSDKLNDLFGNLKGVEGSSRFDGNDNDIRDDSLGNISSANENIELLHPAKFKKQKNKKKRKASDSSDSDQISGDKVGKKKPKSKVKKEDKRTRLQENSFESTENKSILIDSKPDLKNTQNDYEKHDIARDLKTTLDEKIDEKKKKKKDRTRENKLKDYMASENEIIINELQASKEENKKVCKEFKIGEASNDENNGKRKKSRVNIEEENPAKKVASNEKRLQAAKEREASSLSKQSVITSALNNLDSNGERVKNPKHIKFDEEYEEEEQVVEEKEKKTEGKISGSKASKWLGLDAASDEDDDDEEFAGNEVEDRLFAAKPQFEGETGHKLFKLQKSYRGDSRFQLDERFAENDESEDDENDGGKHSGAVVYSSDSEGEATNDDDISKQLSREKDLSMSVLRGILGHNIGTKYGERTSTKDRFTDSNLIRYDPTRDDHAQFEQKPTKQDERPEPVAGDGQQEDTEGMRSAPEVTKEKFYDVKTNVLTEMFGKNKSDDNITSFKFLSDQGATEDTEDHDSNWGVTEELRSKPWNPIMLPYDSSGDEEDGMEHEDEQEHVQAAPEERFFFHFGDSDLERRVDDEEGLFMRTESLDQLNEHWIATRSDLTQDYKKKHKDAMKRQSKMAAKRARMR